MQKGQRAAARAHRQTTPQSGPSDKLSVTIMNALVDHDCSGTRMQRRLSSTCQTGPKGAHVDRGSNGDGSCLLRLPLLPLLNAEAAMLPSSAKSQIIRFNRTNLTPQRRT